MRLLLPNQNDAAEPITYVLASNGVDDIIGRGTKQLSDDGKLVDVILSREKRLALKHFGKDATGTPNVYLDVVFLPGEHDFGCTVVSGGNVARHLGVLDSCQAKVANFQVAVFVDEDVTRLQVTVNDTGGMDVFEASLCHVSSHTQGVLCLDRHTMIWYRKY